MTHGVCDSDPHPPLGRETWTGPLSREGPIREGRLGFATPASRAQPWLGVTSSPRGSPESLPDSHTVQLSWTRWHPLGGSSRPAPAPSGEGRWADPSRSSPGCGPGAGWGGCSEGEDYRLVLTPAGVGAGAFKVLLAAVCRARR